MADTSIAANVELLTVIAAVAILQLIFVLKSSGSRVPLA
jgi:hypothetical protein